MKSSADIEKEKLVQIFEESLLSLKTGTAWERKFIFPTDLSDEQFAAFCEGLSENGNVKILLLNEFDLNENRLKMLADALKKNTTLHSISFNGANVSSTDSLLQFLETIKHKKPIKSIELTNVGCGDYLFNKNTGKLILKTPDLKLDENLIECRNPNKDSLFFDTPWHKADLPDKLLQGVKKILECEDCSLENILVNQPKELLSSIMQDRKNAGEESCLLPKKDYILTQFVQEDSMMNFLSLDCIKVQDSLNYLLAKVNDNDTQRLRELNLHQQKLSVSDIKQIHEVLSHQHNCVLALNLEGATVDADAFPDLLNLLAIHPIIQELNLNYLKFSPTKPNEAQVKAMQEGFRSLGANNTVLRKIYLKSVVDVGDGDWTSGIRNSLFDLNLVTAFLEGLITNQAVDGKEGSKIFHLDLSHDLYNFREYNFRTSLASSDATKARSGKLAQLCSISKTLEVLNISGGGFTLQPIVKALAENSHSKLREFEMALYTWYSGRKDEVQYIAKILEKKSLKKINLYFCHLFAEDAVILAKGLAQSDGLEELNLSGNPIGYKTSYSRLDPDGVYYDKSYRTTLGLEPLVAAITENKNSVLEKVNFTNCYIRDEHFNVMAELLRKSQTITSFYFSDNRLGGAGLQILLDALKTNPRLIQLTLSTSVENNELGWKEFIAPIIKCVEKNKNRLSEQVSQALMTSGIKQVLFHVFKETKKEDSQSRTEEFKQQGYANRS